MPKGFCISTSISTKKTKPMKAPATTFVQQPEPIKVEVKDDGAAKRGQRVAKDKAQLAAVIYNPPKPLKSTSDVLRKCQQKLSLLQKHSCAEPFLRSVDPIALGIPDYPTIVKEPMDLGTVEKKLKNGLYSTAQQFATDVRKIWGNAILYNPKTSPIHNMTRNIQEYFESIFQDVEEAPLANQPVEQAQKKAIKVEKRVDELKTKGPLESENTDKPLTLPEKMQLKKLIQSMVVFNLALSCEHLVGIREIICEEYPALITAQEFEFDLRRLSTRVLRKFEKYINEVHSQGFTSKLTRKQSQPGEQPSSTQYNRGKPQDSPHTVFSLFSQKPMASSSLEHQQASAVDRNLASRRKDFVDDDDLADDVGSSFMTGKFKVIQI